MTTSGKLREPSSPFGERKPVCMKTNQLGAKARGAIKVFAHPQSGNGRDGPSPPGKSESPSPVSKGAVASAASELSYQRRNGAQAHRRNGEHRKNSRVLLDERPLILLPSLAKAVGVDAAIAIHQLHFHLTSPRNGRVRDGKRWVFNTYEQWQENDLPFWNVFKIQRVFLELEKRKLIVSCQPEGRASRRKGPPH